MNTLLKKVSLELNKVGLGIVGLVTTYIVLLILKFNMLYF